MEHENEAEQAGEAKKDVFDQGGKTMDFIDDILDMGDDEPIVPIYPLAQDEIEGVALTLIRIGDWDALAKWAGESYRIECETNRRNGDHAAGLVVDKNWPLLIRWVADQIKQDGYTKEHLAIVEGAEEKGSKEEFPRDKDEARGMALLRAKDWIALINWVADQMGAENPKLWGYPRS